MTYRFFLIASLIYALGFSPLPCAAEDIQPGNATTTMSLEKISKANPQQKPEDAAAPVIKTDDKEEVARIEAFLNSFKSLKADFMQTLSDGTTLKGKVAIARPGKMRLEYEPPNENLLVADGAFVHVWDGQSKTGSSVPLGTSLADIILRDDLKLGGDIRVSDIKEYPAALLVTLVQSDNPAAGSLTLEFEDRPLKLKNWRVVDAQGLETRVAIYNQEMDVAIPSSTFFYRDPNVGAGRKR